MTLVDQFVLGAARYGDPDETCRVLVVGEDNPYGADPQFALYPMPTGCSGYRLCHDVFAITQLRHLGLWRANLCEGKWSTKAARERVRQLFVPEAPWTTAVLLGKKVREVVTKTLDADGVLGNFEADYYRGVDGEQFLLIALPHPSGRNLAWNQPSVRANARRVLAEHIPEIPWGETLEAPR